jgi:hypothetical protein
LAVPREAKHTKVARAQGMMKGIRTRLADEKVVVLSDERFTPGELIEVYKQHLDALRRIWELDIERALAIEKERAIDKRVKAVTRDLKSFIGGRHGLTSVTMREFGLAPNKVPKMSAMAKKVANEKRQATRKARRTMGRKQRARIKG